MKLKIIDYFWSVGHRTKRVGSHRMPLVEGETRKVHYLLFKIDSVETDKVIVSVSREDGTLIKTLTVEKGNAFLLIPMAITCTIETMMRIIWGKTATKIRTVMMNFGKVFVTAFLAINVRSSVQKIHNV